MAVQISHPLIHNSTTTSDYFQFLEFFKKVIYIYLNVVPFDCQSQRQNSRNPQIYYTKYRGFANTQKAPYKNLMFFHD